eukprot:SAG31_NODE_42_length_31262_cov_46.416231_1_plen_165_part_00
MVHSRQGVANLVHNVQAVAEYRPALSYSPHSLLSVRFILVNYNTYHLIYFKNRLVPGPWPAHLEVGLVGPPSPPGHHHRRATNRQRGAAAAARAHGADVWRQQTPGRSWAFRMTNPKYILKLVTQEVTLSVQPCTTDRAHSLERRPAGARHNDAAAGARARRAP